MKDKCNLLFIRFNGIITLAVVLLIAGVVFAVSQGIFSRIVFLFAVDAAIIVFGYFFGLARTLVLTAAVVSAYGISLFCGNGTYDIKDFFWVFVFAVSGYGAGKLSEETGKMFTGFKQKYEYVKKYGVLDEETGFTNCRRFSENVGQEIGRHCRYGMPMTVMVLRICRYRELSRLYGEEGRRKIILAMVSGIEKTLRTEDRKARLGEDTFALLLVNTGKDGAETVKKRLRKKIDKSLLETEEKVIPFEYRTGIALPLTGEETGEDLLQKALGDIK